MTGSRRHDILGKKENNLSNIRTLYRFENREELMHAEADQIVVTTTDWMSYGIIEVRNYIFNNLRSEI